MEASVETIIDKSYSREGRNVGYARSAGHGKCTARLAETKREGLLV